MISNDSRRAEILARVAAGTLTLKQAASLLDLSYRHAKRLSQRYQREGSAGLVHGHTGHRSNRAKPAEIREQALDFIRRRVDDGLGPTLAAAALVDENRLGVSQETLRRWMVEAGLWNGSRRRQAEQEAVPCSHFGEAVNLFGRVCAWREERRAVNWIIQLIDDATGTMTLRVTREPIWALAGVLRQWIEQYGIPRALRVDWNRLGMRESASEAPVAGPSPVAQFRRMCGALNIPIASMNRSEQQGRTLETHWVRLVDDFCARGIGNDKDANAYLDGEYVPSHNRQFARAPAAAEYFHRPSPGVDDLDAVFRLEEERPISDKWVVHYRGRQYQVQRESRFAPARDMVVVYEWPNRRLEIHYRGRAVKWRQLPAAADAAATRSRRTTAVSRGGHFYRAKRGTILMSNDTRS